MTKERGYRPAPSVSPRACVVCGETFQPYRANGFTCSRKCYRRQPHAKAASYEQRKPGTAYNERKNAARRLENNPARKEVNLRSSVRRYGIDFEDYQAMLAAQGGRCFLCGAVPTGGIKAASRLHIDHDHATGKVRALLCNGCNRGIGYLQDDPELLRAAADYIETHKASTAGVAESPAVELTA